MKGAALIKTFLDEHKTDMRRLFNESKDHKRVALRAKLIRALHHDGLNYSEISRVLEIDRGTVRYWLIDEHRESKRRWGQNERIRVKRRVIYNWWDECARAMGT